MCKIIGIAVPETVLLLPSDKPLRFGNKGILLDHETVERLRHHYLQPSQELSAQLELSDRKTDSGN
jgi:hypothetical protein